MRTVKHNQKAIKTIDQLRKQLQALHQKQEYTRERLRAALRKAGPAAGKSLRRIHPLKPKKKT